MLDLSHHSNYGWWLEPPPRCLHKLFNTVKEYGSQATQGSFQKHVLHIANCALLEYHITDSQKSLPLLKICHQFVKNFFSLFSGTRGVYPGYRWTVVSCQKSSAASWKRQRVMRWPWKDSADALGTKLKTSDNELQQSIFSRRAPQVTLKFCAGSKMNICCLPERSEGKVGKHGRQPAAESDFRRGK